MKKSRKMFADKKFQLKFATGVVITTAVTVSLFIVLIMVASIKNNQKLNIVLDNQNVLTSNQNEVLKTMLVLSDSKKKNTVHLSTDIIQQDIDANKVRSNQNNALIGEINERNRQLVYLLIGFVILQSIFLFVILVRRTNRISGPLFILNRYITELRDGKYPDVRPLRPKDDLQDLFDNFRHMVKELKAKKH
jgi:hypothetical protein